VLRRGEWDDLRQRLERLPAGHPSSPHDSLPDDGDGPDDGDWPGDAGSRPGPAESEPAETDDQEADPDTGRATRGPHAEGHRGGSPDRHDGRWAALPGQREPYRPWFTAGESPEPWFYPDPGA
jgi:hypothetical protein